MLALCILSSFQPYYSNSIPFPPRPEIISIKTDYPSDGNWIRLPQETKEITFNVEAKNTETMFFWLIPTGTATWRERRLIGYAISSNRNDNDFVFTWNIDKPYLYHHVHIQALGESELSNEVINIIME